MEVSVREGTPVNPPIWWIDPEDEVALAIDDGKYFLELETDNRTGMMV